MNRVYKLTPVSMYDVRGLEKWLEQLAAKGLFLKQYRPLVCTFTKGEPQQVRYRLEPWQWLSDEFPEDMVELFRECGWEYVGGVNHEMLIFSSANPHAPEPHTDPDIQLEQWNKLYQKARKDFYQMALLTLAFLALAAVLLFWGGTPLTRLLIFNSTVWMLGFYCVLYPLFDLGVNYARARELAAVIRELEGTKKRRLWFPSRQFFSWTRLAYFLSLFFLLLWAEGLELGQPQPITEFTPLAVTDPDSGRTVGSELADWGFSPLCPNQRRSWDFETDLDRILFLEVHWFDFPHWLSFLAVPAAKDLMNSSLKLNGQFPWRDKEAAVWTIREVPEAGADWLSMADSENGTYHTVSAALGDKAVLIQYVGGGDLWAYLDQIVDMVR